jgi:hypothetical protein
MSARIAAHAATALALLAAGCGGGSSGAGGDGSWGQRADVICDRAETAIRAIEAPEDIGDLGRVMVRASEEIRWAIGEIRKLEASGEEKAHAKRFLDDLALVEQTLARIGDAATAGERRPIEKAGERARVDAVDLAAHAEVAGLTRCGREAAGVAAADAVLTPAWAEYVAEDIGTFVIAERTLARRWNPEGTTRERARYWIGLWELVERTEPDGSQPPEEAAEESREAFFDAWRELRDGADFQRALAEGEQPITDGRPSEAESRRRVKAFAAAAVGLLEDLGPAGAARLRDLENLGEGPSGGSEAQES